ncbi:Imm21 family immunity protein [Kitasatospora sp. NPDC004272]
MNTSVRVPSMGGPLVVVPCSALAAWGGCTPEALILGGSGLDGTGGPDDYDRACGVEGWAETVALRGSRLRALVLGGEPATTCYLPAHRIFVRWTGGYDWDELLPTVGELIADPAITWEDCGSWETDGPAVLMDSAEAGADLGISYPPYPDGDGRVPAEAPVPLPAGRWRVRSDATGGLLQLLPVGR